MIPVAQATALDTSPRSGIGLRVLASPNQRVVVMWEMLCARGGSAGAKKYTLHGQYTPRTPNTRLLLQPKSHYTSCEVVGNARMPPPGGSIRVEILN